MTLGSRRKQYEAGAIWVGLDLTEIIMTEASNSFRQSGQSVTYSL